MGTLYLYGDDLVTRIQNLEIIYMTGVHVGVTIQPLTTILLITIHIIHYTHHCYYAINSINAFICAWALLPHHAW